MRTTISHIPQPCHPLFGWQIPFHHGRVGFVLIIGNAAPSLALQLLLKWAQTTHWTRRIYPRNLNPPKLNQLSRGHHLSMGRGIGYLLNSRNQYFTVARKCHQAGLSPFFEEVASRIRAPKAFSVLTSSILLLPMGSFGVQLEMDSQPLLLGLVYARRRMVMASCQSLVAINWWTRRGKRGCHSRPSCSACSLNFAQEPAAGMAQLQAVIEQRTARHYPWGQPVFFFCLFLKVTIPSMYFGGHSEA